jgi:two-component system, cell cycle sensor histidine kinase and response regulator CckA
MSFEETCRQRQAEELYRNEEQLQDVFFHAATGIAQIGLDGAWLRVNNCFCQAFGYSEAELRAKALADLTHPDDWSRTLDLQRQLLAGEISSLVFEGRCVRKDGTVFWGRLNRSLVRDRSHRPKYFIAVVEDITDKIQAEATLRDRDRQLALAQIAGQLGLWERDLRTGVTVTSSEFARLHGLKPNEFPLDHEEYFRLVHPEDVSRIRKEYQESVERTHAWDTELRVVWPDGSVHWLLGKGQVFLDEDGLPARLAGITLDITERKEAESRLRESEQRFRSMADAAPIMVCASGADKRATFFNRGWLEFVGRGMEEELGYGWTEGLHPDDRDATLASYSSSFDVRGDCNIEFRLRRADGEYRWILCSGKPRFDHQGTFTGYIASAVDVTDLKRAQEEALARQKWESLGILAGGIAHDFGNLLGAILAQAEVVEAPSEEIQQIKECALRGSEIVRQIMAYAGGGQADTPDAVDLSQLVEGMLGLLGVSICKHAVLRTKLGNNLPAVKGSAPQLRQVVLNLVINASEAVGEKGGVITVTVDRPNDLAHPKAMSLPSGDYIRLEVSDTGSGIADGARAKIFDPFFTTKSAGRGLGLAVVQGIVRGLHGAIFLSSEPEQGTTFQIFLPACKNVVVADKRWMTSTHDAAPLFRKATILVVEDEAALRQAVSKALRNKGLSVIEAGDGSTALEVIRVQEYPIDIVLLDMSLPGNPSREVFEEAQRVNPEMNVIVTSAFNKDFVEETLRKRVEHFIRKPYMLSDLIGLVRQGLT